MGATGLEPATSGVTGRVGHHDARRRASLNGLICRHFSRVALPRLRMVEPIVEGGLGHEWATRCCQSGQQVIVPRACARPTATGPAGSPIARRPLTSASETSTYRDAM